MPILVNLKMFMNGDPIMVNMSKVQTITTMKDDTGCVLTFDSGRKVFVKDSAEAIFNIVKQFITEEI